MSVNTVSNRQILSTFRTTLNSWAAAINTALGNITTLQSQVATNTTNIATNTTNIATNTSNISTNTTDIATNTADISSLSTNKQDALALSTLNYGYTNAISLDYTLQGGDLNKLFDITNVGATSFTLPATGTIPGFRVGCVVFIYNNSSSGGNITLVAGGGVTLSQGPGVTIAPGAVATVMRIGTSRYLRLY